MNERQQEALSSVLLSGLLVLQLPGNETRGARSARRHRGCPPRESLCLYQLLFFHRAHAPPCHDRYVHSIGFFIFSVPKSS